MESDDDDGFTGHGKQEVMQFGESDDDQDQSESNMMDEQDDDHKPQLPKQS